MRKIDLMLGLLNCKLGILINRPELSRCGSRCQTLVGKVEEFCARAALIRSVVDAIFKCQGRSCCVLQDWNS